MVASRALYQENLNPEINPTSLSVSRNPNYVAAIIGKDPKNGNKIEVIGNIPETFSIQLDNAWEPLVGSGVNSGDLAGIAPQSKLGNSFANAGNWSAKLFGLSGIIQALSIQTWRGTGPIRLQIPFQFNAFNDPYNDVVKPQKDLMRLASPFFAQQSQLQGFGLLHAPGPTAIDILRGNFDAQISIYIGRALYLPSVVIENVQIDVDSKYDKNGQPISSNANVAISSLFTLAREDLENVLFPNANNKFNSVTPSNNSVQDTGRRAGGDI